MDKAHSITITFAVLPACLVGILVYCGVYSVAAALVISNVIWKFWLPSSASTATPSTTTAGTTTRRDGQETPLTTLTKLLEQAEKAASSTRNSGECIICWHDDGDDCDKVKGETNSVNPNVRLRCTHIMCLDCIRSWFGVKGQACCPLCRRTIIQNPKSIAEMIEKVTVCCQGICIFFIPLEAIANACYGSRTMALANAGSIVSTFLTLARSRQRIMIYGIEWWRHIDGAEAGRWLNLLYWATQVLWTVLQVHYAYAIY